MKELETGMLARSKAGHDKGQIYIIKDMDENDVYLVNGENRTCDKPKKNEKEACTDHYRTIRDTGRRRCGSKTDTEII